MPTQTLTLELPQEIVELLGSAESASVRAREALVLDLLRDGKISQGRAAGLLGITRWEILDLMARYHIPSGPESTDEIEREIEAVRRVAGKS